MEDHAIIRTQKKWISYKEVGEDFEGKYIKDISDEDLLSIIKFIQHNNLFHEDVLVTMQNEIAWRLNGIWTAP